MMHYYAVELNLPIQCHEYTLNKMISCHSIGQN